MSDVYKIQYMNNTLTYPGWNGYVGYEDVPSYRTLTLQTDGHGTLTATTLTGYPGDKITLTPTYNTYYRFNNYSNTGGSIAGNVFTFGDTDATAKANFKVNAFTASGGWEKGSNVGANYVNQETYFNVPEKYATVSYHTSNVPTAWYATSNRWKPTNPSAYKISINAKMGFSGKKPKTVSKTIATAVCLIGSTQTQSQTLTWTTNSDSWSIKDYSKSFTSNNVNVNYGLSARLFIGGSNRGGLWYIANRTTGTWTATGYAP